MKKIRKTFYVPTSTGQQLEFNERSATYCNANMDSYLPTKRWQQNKPAFSIKLSSECGRWSGTELSLKTALHGLVGAGRLKMLGRADPVVPSFLVLCETVLCDCYTSMYNLIAGTRPLSTEGTNTNSMSKCFGISSVGELRQTLRGGQPSILLDSLTWLAVRLRTLLAPRCIISKNLNAS